MKEARTHLSKILRCVGKGEHHTITRNGRKIAVILSKAEFEKLRKTNSED